MREGQPHCQEDHPLKWLGYDAEHKGHYYGSGHDEPESCLFYSVCQREWAMSQERYHVAFGPIPVHARVAQMALGKRGLIERTFSRNKHGSGPDKVTLVGKEDVAVLVSFSDICEILRVMSKILYRKAYAPQAA